MNILERLISGYPSGDVAPQDFIDHLSIGAEGWVGAWIAVGLDKEGHFYAPYPGHPSCDDFVFFYKREKTLFATDLNHLYESQR